MSTANGAGQTNWKNVNKWHRVSKNCTGWTSDYLKANLKGVSVDGADGLSAAVTSVTGVSGDVELNQRKGKLITIFDLSINLAWEATTASGDKVTGRLHLPECMNDQDLDDIESQAQVTVDGENKAVKDLVTKKLVPEISKKVLQFPGDLIEFNRKDVYIEKQDMVGHPVLPLHPGKSSSPFPAQKSASSSAPESSSVKGGLVTVNQNVEFVCAPEDVYRAFVDQGRVNVWTRAPAKVEEKVGGRYEVMGGNVTGEFKELVPNQRIVLSWRLSSWPSEHFSTVRINLERLEGSTKLLLEQSGVPIGEKDDVADGWEKKFWNPMKGIFGWGAVF
ncbi:hypothetical protein M427DRAFT_53380 [Gonapodya prolifera JEL478]|uniref:Activator of Hsp90 ATPase AHSA1-like N-terminal domain-containing protein n=1 Tax=Gonapodya prolifera (strain JEL478) TaxID=1344416 RepID=A0A139AQ81_GONPJ|nr:hypothetical protein M427DRAFT_53380 [Gonapodya prolifera JEL478]|eukprot:KXS18899.1 hypothetical protein M427DRAFT_53380 [Gonapodya prolifera JEL478]